MKTAIVTGATGFIGSWLLEKLIHEGVQVTALVLEDEDFQFEPSIGSACKVVRYRPDLLLDLEDFDNGSDVFYNLGWGGVAPEQKNDLEIQFANIRSSVDAVRFASKIGCARFVGIGTASEYVYCDGLISSKEPPSPADFYGAAKVSARYMSKQLADMLGIGFIWTILPSTFGPRRNDNNIVTYTIRTLLDGGCPSYTKLEQMWDFLYIEDVVNALFLIGKKGVDGKFYGIGSGVHRPLREYIESIRDAVNPDLPLGVGDRPYPQGTVPSSCIDANVLVADTGFTPTFTFEEGIEKTIHYFKGKQK